MVPNLSIHRTSGKLRLLSSGDFQRSSTLRADERARVVPNIGFSALRAVEPSLECQCFAATSSSHTRVPTAHHDSRNLTVPRPGGGSAPCGMMLNSCLLGNYNESVSI